MKSKTRTKQTNKNGRLFPKITSADVELFLKSTEGRKSAVDLLSMLQQVQKHLPAIQEKMRFFEIQKKLHIVAEKAAPFLQEIPKARKKMLRTETKSGAKNTSTQMIVIRFLEDFHAGKINLPDVQCDSTHPVSGKWLIREFMNAVVNGDVNAIHQMAFAVSEIYSRASGHGASFKIEPHDKMRDLFFAYCEEKGVPKNGTEAEKILSEFGYAVGDGRIGRRLLQEWTGMEGSKGRPAAPK